MPARAAAIATMLAIGTTGLWSSAGAETPSRPGKLDITPIEGLKMLYERGMYAKARQIGYAILWKDIEQPEALRWLAGALEQLGEKDEAAVFAHLLLRVLQRDRYADDKQADRLRRWGTARLKTLDADVRAAQDKHLADAPGRRFTTPEAVDDGWMTQVAADLHCLHGLYAWKLVGGRKDAKPDWIHNRQGAMHRSGMKLVEEVDGRTGVLFSVPIKAATSPDADEHHRAALQRLGHPTQVTTRNAGKCRCLRIGTRAYGFPYILEVLVEGKPVYSKLVGVKAWEDLKVPLGEAAGKDVEVVLQLVVPEKQRWSEGVWLDYVEFFDN